MIFFPENAGTPGGAAIYCQSIMQDLSPSLKFLDCLWGPLREVVWFILDEDQVKFFLYDREAKTVRTYEPTKSLIYNILVALREAKILPPTYRLS